MFPKNIIRSIFRFAFVPLKPKIISILRQFCGCGFSGRRNWNPSLVPSFLLFDSRSSRSGERKKDKDDRNSRETKKIENDKNVGRKHGIGGGGYDSVGRKGFAPRGEPSRRGRGGFMTGGRGNLGNVGGHYGPPGSKSPFPQTSHHLLDNKSAEEDVSSEKPLDMDHTDDKSKKAQQHSNITGILKRWPPHKKPHNYDQKRTEIRVALEDLAALFSYQEE